MYVPAPVRTGRARAPAAAPLLALVAALLGSGARAQTAAAGGSSALPTVQQSECAPQFLVSGIVVSGCTTLESPAGNQPYCLLAAPRNGTKVGLCSLDSIRPRFGKAPDGTVQPCDASTPVPDLGGVVFGCFTTNSVGSQLTCNSGARGLLPCLVASAAAPNGSAAPAPTRSADGPPAAATPASPPPSNGAAAARPRGGLSTAGIALVVAGGSVASLVVLAALFYRRRRRQANAVVQDDFAPEKRFEATAAATPISAKKVEPRFEVEVVAAAPASGEDAVKYPGAVKAYRSSSQFGYQNPASTPDSKAPTATSPPPLPHQAAAPQRSLGKFVIASTYTPTLNDEIMIQPGDIVEVYQEFDDGWCSAINLTRDRARGVFPMHCIDRNMGRLDD